MNADQQLIAQGKSNGFKDYTPSELKVTDDFELFPDGHTAYRVEVYKPLLGDLAQWQRSDEIIADECYWATVVDGEVYGNVELGALPQEYSRRCFYPPKKVWLKAEMHQSDPEDYTSYIEARQLSTACAWVNNSDIRTEADFKDPIDADIVRLAPAAKESFVKFFRFHLDDSAGYPGDVERWMDAVQAKLDAEKPKTIEQQATEVLQKAREEGWLKSDDQARFLAEANLLKDDQS